MLVITTKGLVERDRLEVKDIVTQEQNARVIATEWYLPDEEGRPELVRRDVNVNLLTGMAMVTEQERL